MLFNALCLRTSRSGGRRDAGASQGRRDALARKHKAPEGRAGNVALRRRRLLPMSPHRRQPGSWHGRISNSLKSINNSLDGLLLIGPALEGAARMFHEHATKLNAGKDPGLAAMPESLGGQIAAAHGPGEIPIYFQ